VVDGGRVPWEDNAVPFPANIGLTWWESLVRPASFFGRVDWDGPMSRPLLYWLLAWILAGAIGLLWAPAELEALSLALGLEAAADGRLVQLLNFFVSPFAALGALAVAMVLHHLPALLLAPDRRGIDATGRVVCYTGGPLILASIPAPWLLDWLLTMAVWVWIVTLLVLGFRQAHRTSTPRAVAIVAIPVVVMGALAAMTVLILAAVLASLPELLP
jgi:hypothetical protein